MGSGEVSQTVVAFSVGAALMTIARLVAWFLTVDTERRSLEDLARPLSATGSG